MNTETFITKEEFASKLNGRQYRSELTNEDKKEAQQNGLVVVFGASDDLIEFNGSISEEGDCYDGAYFRITSKKLKVKFGEHDSKNSIYADWCNPELNTSWSYKTKIPHATFNIFEDDELYCIGIVFSIYDLV
jgi:hypothetical protein